MGGINFGDIFSSMVEGPDVDALIKLGNLTDFHYFSQAEMIELHNVKNLDGGASNDELLDGYGNDTLVGDGENEMIKQLFLSTEGNEAYCGLFRLDERTAAFRRQCGRLFHLPRTLSKR